MIKLILVSFSFEKGGAAIAANNFFSLLKGNPTWHAEKVSQDQAGLFQFFKRVLSFGLGKLQVDKNPTKHSLNLFSYTPVLGQIASNPTAIFHFHWVNNDTLSVWDFDRIPPGSIITLHDEWIYCGTEHYYKLDDPEEDYIKGYELRKNGILGLNLNYFIWKKKYSAIADRKDLLFTVPSTWMQQRARKSKILRNSIIEILPNCIDTEIFSPAESSEISKFRQSLNLQNDDCLIAFGAIDGDKNYLKGSHLLMKSLEVLQRKLSDSEKKRVKLLSFGGQQRKDETVHGFPLISLGHIKEKSKLALLYSSSDFVVVPSMVESFGQVAAEALASETPVICFRASGLLDIVEESKTGLFAEPYSIFSLAEKMNVLIQTPKSQLKEMGRSGRVRVISNFSRPVITVKYQRVIELASRLKSNSTQ